jgi:hypothetical protein
MMLGLQAPLVLKPMSSHQYHKAGRSNPITPFLPLFRLKMTTHNTLTDLSSNNEIPHYPVSVWETILIVMGAITLIAAGMIGLGIKVLNNAFDPVQAEAIARSLLDYKIPGGSQGVFGINIGSAKLAWVRSTTSPADVLLFVGKTPLNKEVEQEAQQELRRDFENPPSDEANQPFEVLESHTERRLFCGTTILITVEVGRQTLDEFSAPVPAVRYIASRKEGPVERLVILTVNGKNSDKKADEIFSSLRCK